jgi:hypothetical protein
MIAFRVPTRYEVLVLDSPFAVMAISALSSEPVREIE